MIQFFLVLWIPVTLVFSQNLRTFSYQEITGDILNPERGWMDPNFGTDGESSYSGTGTTLTWVKLRADDYRGKDFDQTFLTRVENSFNYARKNGLKVIPRVLYNHDGGGADANLTQVLKHIEQIKPIYQKHADVIHVVDPGFIGAWGEWHTSSNNLTEHASRNAIIKAVLELAPKDRMIYLRYPHYKLHFLSGNYTSTSPWLDSTQAFNRTDIARIGHLNDCLFYDNSDRGTYQQGINREFGLKYIGQEGPYVPFGGETCGAGGAESSCSNSLKELAILHINHLNNGYDKANHTRWKNEGCYDEISRRLGYRYVLEQLTHTAEVPPGGKLSIDFKITNKGFGELFNPRFMDIVLIAADGKETRATTNIDPRWWKGSTSYSVNLIVEIPSNFVEGAYKIGLAFPDMYTSLKSNPKYAVRLANTNVWDATKGINIVSDKVNISKSAPGTTYPNQTALKASAPNFITPIFTAQKLKVFSEIKVQANKKVLEISNLSQNGQKPSFQLYDMSGRLIHQVEMDINSQNVSQVNLEDINNGIYILNIKDQKQILHTTKLTFLGM